MSGICLIVFLLRWRDAENTLKKDENKQRKTLKNGVK